MTRRSTPFDPGYENIPARPSTKAKLTAIKQVAGLTYDEALDMVLDAFLEPQDLGSFVQAGLRLRQEAAEPAPAGA